MERADRPAGAPSPDAALKGSGAKPAASEHAYLGAVLEAMSDGFVALDREWRYLYANPRAAEILGREPGTLEGKHVWTEFPEAAEQAFRAVCERVMKTGVPETVEGYSAARRQWFESRIRATPEGIAILFADVTERHLKSERLERAVHDFAALAEHAPDSVVRVGRDLVYRYANPTTAQVLGLRVDQIIGARVGELIERRQMAIAWRDALEVAFERGEPGAATYPVQRSIDPEQRWFESRFVPEIEEGAQEVTSVLIVTREVTEQRRAQEALERLAALVRSSDDAIVGMSVDGTITSWNPAAERTFGYATSEALGRSMDVIVAPHARAEARALRARVARGESASHPNLWHQRKDGREIPIAVTMAPVRDASGAVTGISAIKRDISDQQLLEAQLREAQKMEAVGRLAGGIAHDFNNLLTAILGSAELSLANPALEDAAIPGADELRGDLEQIRGAAMRAGDLTKQLLAFSRRQLLRPQVLDVNEVIASADRLLRRAVGDSVTMRLVLGDDVPPVLADRGQLEQVLLNVALNARDAMQERASGASFTLETTALEVRGDHVASSGATLAPGRYARIAARDTGVGMDPAVAERVFEPFFTTKEVGKGTGLGLAMAYGIVTQSGGHITAEGVPGVGSTFTIYLPAADDAVPGLTVARPGMDGPLRDRPQTP